MENFEQTRDLLDYFSLIVCSETRFHKALSLQIIFNKAYMIINEFSCKSSSKQIDIFVFLGTVKWGERAKEIETSCTMKHLRYTSN